MLRMKIYFISRNQKKLINNNYKYQKIIKLIKIIKNLHILIFNNHNHQ